MPHEHIHNDPCGLTTIYRPAIERRRKGLRACCTHGYFHSFNHSRRFSKWFPKAQLLAPLYDEGRLAFIQSLKSRNLVKGLLRIKCELLVSAMLTCFYHLRLPFSCSSWDIVHSPAVGFSGLRTSRLRPLRRPPYTPVLIYHVISSPTSCYQYHRMQCQDRHGARETSVAFGLKSTVKNSGMVEYGALRDDNYYWKVAIDLEKARKTRKPVVLDW